MDTRTDLLIEIGTEELPPIALPTLSKAFGDGLRSQLESNGIAFDALEGFAAPRRLALLVRGIERRQPDQETLRRGPALKAAFDADGQPTKAALGFARSCGVEVEALGREETDKGVWLTHRSITPGKETTTLAPSMAEAALEGLPIPKRMRWGAGSEEFVRPVHWVCMLLGTERVPGKVLGLETVDHSFGHRFHHPDPIPLENALDYAERLRTTGFVEPSFEARRALIQSQVETLAAEHSLKARMDETLLDEVTALVEWPQALLCSFDARFLEIPSEVLIETMQSNQKYFPLEDAQGSLRAEFIVVANIVSRDPAQVRSGNERVIRPRFEDAAFFWSQDLKQPLADLALRLEGVVFQDKLGTLAEKGQRVGALGRELADVLGTDATLIERAAHLAKCDLVTSMVFEFPSLQGVMGRYYAERSNEDPCVCVAMEEQYRPRFAGDDLPKSPCGLALAIADRLDTLVGVFGIGLKPTGTKDPYGLRRASIAVLRLLIETPLDLDLKSLLERAASGFPEGVLGDTVVENVLGYMMDRLRGYYGDQGVSFDSVEAVIETGITNPWDLDRRVKAVAEFRQLPAAESLAAANKRIRNILVKAEVAPEGANRVEEALLSDPAEIQLASRIKTLASQIAPLVAERDYVGVLRTLADLREDVDRFFEDVMVMAEDEAVRRNRIGLLQSLSALFLQVADISKLQ
ncbi:glycine--tRNA ligase subunit beta [Thiorhodococcus mannitoliphagus]|uniref:Glycine--tRNA ligase beta subunit n=1 Tax=Thiorhodococcus mannitoliphagus TaxID=329406 RepID=A0A6P1DQ25_9GAMM|nr:glycine--tRNA ligase subunit beta [Thiorhodococcus mannitoliphagus]NEX18766.1 glycine--tRNA ligase subunit beta [Thiorhodococcus mannitoliphagus]